MAQDRHFRPADRLRKRRDYLRVYAQGRRGWAPGFTVFVAGGEGGRHRLGLTVTRQVGKAVLRNRIKRRLREAFRLHRGEFPGCYDIVVNARREAASAGFPELARALVVAVERAARARPRSAEAGAPAGPRRRGKSKERR